MPYFDVIIAPISPQGGKDATASVVGPMTEKEYESRYATTPANSGVTGQTNAGYPNRLLAQAAANKFNASGQGKGLGVASHPPPNPLDLLGKLDLAHWVLRIGEIVLGIVLIGVGLAKLTGADNFISKAALSAGKVAML